MGRTPKPVEQKRLLGNPGKRPLPSSALALAPAVTAALYDLDPADSFQALLLEGFGWLGATDSVVLGLLREGLDERRELRERALGGSSEARRELRALEEQLTKWLGSLGFDPASRGRLGLAEVKTRSTLEKLRQDRQGQVADPRR